MSAEQPSNALKPYETKPGFVLITEINWDIDVDSQDGVPDVPTSMLVPSDLRTEQEVADCLSDQSGWCVNAFTHPDPTFPDGE